VNVTFIVGVLHYDTNKMQMSICSFCLLINFVMVIFLRGCNFLGPLDCIDSKSPSGYETMCEISHTNPRYTCTRHRDND